MTGSALCATAIVLVTCTCALADVSCVQQELTRIGFDPGPIDGALGRKTLTAAASFQRAAPYLVDLSVDTSDIWCAALRKQLADVAVDAGKLPVDGPSAFSGATSGNAMGTTPILGVTPEYQVPAWVNNPH